MTDTHKTLRQLYPHLGGTGSGPTHASLIDSISHKSADSASTQQRFLNDNAEALIEAAAALAESYRRGGKLLCMGNGGSSCDAAHLAVEFNHPVTTGRRALPAINLAADIAMISAVSNDVGFDEVFQRQVIALGLPGDTLCGISTSGNSRNLELAFEEARRRDLTTIALLGGDGGRIAAQQLAEHCLTVRSDSIHRIQESHVITYHILWDLVHTLLAGAS